MGTHTDSTLFRNSSGQFFNSGTDSTFSRYSQGFYHFLVLTLILPFFETRPDRFSIVAQILPFPVTRPDSTIFSSHIDSALFRNLYGQFFNSGTDSTFSQYSPLFYHFSVLTLILLFSDTRPDSFSIVARILPFLVLARILQFSGTHIDSTLFRNSSRRFFNSGTDSTFSRFSPGFFQFLVLTLILPFSETRPDSFSIVARILPFLGTRPDYTIFRYPH